MEEPQVRHWTAQGVHTPLKGANFPPAGQEFWHEPLKNTLGLLQDVQLFKLPEQVRH